MNDQTSPTGSQTPQIIGAWLVVGIPLLYGFVETLKNAIKLFNPH